MGEKTMALIQVIKLIVPGKYIANIDRAEPKKKKRKKKKKSEDISLHLPCCLILMTLRMFKMLKSYKSLTNAGKSLNKPCP